MIIGLDLRCLPTDGSPGAGIAHAARAMARALVSRPDRSVRFVIYLPHGAAWGVASSHHVEVVRLPNAGGSSIRIALSHVPCDALIVLSGAVPPRIDVPAIPWIHDVAIFDHPEWFPQGPLRRALTTHLFKQGIHQAPALLTVSQATKDDVIRLFNVGSSRIHVTHEGGDTVLAELQGTALRAAKRQARIRVAERGVSQPYVLVLGTVEPRKNIPFLISAWSHAMRISDRPADLVIAGRDGWKLGPARRAMRHAAYPEEGGPRLHRIEAVTDEDRRDLLLGASVVTIPSLTEGFGLVALEAMQAETAVIASDVGAHPEVVGDAGLLLSPVAAEAWTGALHGLLVDDRTRQHMAEQGKARSQGMTWERAAMTAMETLTGSQS